MKGMALAPVVSATLCELKLATAFFTLVTREGSFTLGFCRMIRRAFDGQLLSRLLCALE